MKKQSGITLVALVITIIVMLILVGVTVTRAISGGLFDKTKEGANKYDKSKDIEQIASAYSLQFQVEKESSSDKTNKELFENVKNSLNFEGATYNIASQFMNIIKSDGTEYTLLSDGTIVEGKMAYLDIADGSIELTSKGYKQGTTKWHGTDGHQYSVSGTEIEYNGEYIITGTSTENMVKITGEKTYNITLKNLNIDSSNWKTICAFNANRGEKETGLYVNLYLEGENSLKSGHSAAGLGFAKGIPNLGGVTNGSTLTIQGDGSLYAEGGHYSAGIGSGYTGFDSAAGAANNIIINSGNITAKSGESDCAGIGGGLRQDVNNIIINGGNINAIATRSNAIGSTSRDGQGVLKGLEINGGNITAIGGYYGGGIGGEKGSEDIKIKGGILSFINTSPYATGYALVGLECSVITIEGGTIIGKSTKGSGVGTKDITQNINITGGSLYLEVPGDKFALAPKSGKNNVYLTKIQLSNITEETQIISLTTNDGIKYGIKDMYTTKDDESTADINEGGMIYLYLPLGTRTITIEAGGNIYSGTVETKEESEVVVLNKK